ncbi:MAG: DUF3810 domain-containing protein [Ruminococcaceae bacterium]|nr:DUF3810 domain-containing protein [Oscillospiraceae bacterium]
MRYNGRRKEFTILKNKSTFYTRNRFFCGAFAYLLVSVVIYVASRASSNFADFISEYPSSWVRLVLAGFTSIFPFSLAEGFLLLLIPLCILFLFFAPDEDEGKRMTRNSYIMLGILFLIVSTYLSVFAPCYFRKPVDEELGLDRKSVTKDDVYNAAVFVSEEIEKLEEEIVSDNTGKTLMPYSYSELVYKLNLAYDSLCDSDEKYDFLGDFYSYPKPLIISKLMPYTRISGFYTFFTGEANISTAYPDFMIPYTIAHEMAHQRGIAREDEANFIAFLVCMESNDSYIRYSGYTELLNYLLDAVYTTDKNLYEETFYNAPKVYREEYSAYIDFIRSTRMDSVSNVTGTINDTMLQSQGQSAGTESYNLVTELASAYFKSELEK